MRKIRDPKRIDKLLKQIKTIWDCHPDMRLCQLIINGFMLDNMITDLSQLYYLEDDKLSQTLENFYLGHEKESKKTKEDSKEKKAKKANNKKSKR